MATAEWVSVREYCKRKGIKSPQIIYNRIAMGKIPKNQWRDVEIKVTRLQMRLD